MQSASKPNELPIGGVFRCVVPVRWGDLDALNHVNNTLYFRYIEEARVQLCESAGIVAPGDRVSILAHASCDFLRPLLYPATVVVGLTLARVGRSSMDLDVTIHSNDDPDILYAKGKNVMVAADSASGKSSPWSDAELLRFAACFHI